MDYDGIRSQMKPGDVIAFGGKGHFSNIIKFATMSSVSHVGVVLQTHVNGDGRYFNQIIESTSIDGFNGVNISRISTRLNAYDGECWWLPLRNNVRERFNEKAFFDFMFAQEGKPYDTRQAVNSAIDGLPFGIGYNKEDFSKLFCSELVAGGFEAGGIVDTNCSEITPIELCRWNLYSAQHQLKGKEMEISRFGTIDVSSLLRS